MFKFNKNGDALRPKLPDLIKIDDITSGRIDPNLIYEEIEMLKAEINVLRNDMSSFLKALATIPEDGSRNEYYQNVIQRLQTVQNDIAEYCERYNKLLPIINLAQIKLGHEVEAPPSSAKKLIPSTSNNTPLLGNKGTPNIITGSPASDATTATPAGSGVGTSGVGVGVGVGAGTGSGANNNNTSTATKNTKKPTKKNNNNNNNNNNNTPATLVTKAGTGGSNLPIVL